MASSVHFEFLRPRRPTLADLGGLAEKYAEPDPPSALVKLRTMAEQMVEIICRDHVLPGPLDANLNDRLQDASFQALVPRVVLDKFHLLRRLGNRAAHSGQGTADQALTALAEAFDLSRWLHGFVDGGRTADLGQFDRARLQTETSKSQLQREKKALLAQLEQQSALLADALKKLDDEKDRRQRVEATVVELEEYRQRAQNTSNALGFSEHDTRRKLIDLLLVEAGWQVGARGTSTDQVHQEVKLALAPDKEGNGFADYVLFGDDGKPLAVIEAKRTAKDPMAGKTQVWLYAQALERQFGRRPVMFFTNGVEVHVWDDRAPAANPRKLYGFYSKDSLDYLFHQRSSRDSRLQVAHNPAICDRPYQVEAIRAVAERFALGHRKALLVLATGTGKTRIAIALCDLLMRAGWAKRILFLCDRKELRKQAAGVFKEFLPDAPRVVVSSATAKDRDQRIYLATYPAMQECYQSFDVGFFDLVIADESHRSIYNRYRDLLQWFDALQIGLTATPRSVMSHQTFGLFGCEGTDPTYAFEYQQAIDHSPPYLVPHRPVAHTTQFLRKGLKWAEMSEAQRRQWEEQDPDAGTGQRDVDASQIDKQVLSKDTTRKVLRNLMEHGIRDVTGSRPGKTIVFARSHHHAVLLAETFAELFPQYGPGFCQVIDSHDERAEQLLAQFKDPASNVTVAVSVDMLDTGIDVPEVVNLVFAKPVRSYVKFWQMIGRGTRLRPNLFGPGDDKKEFLIFDHWANFAWFDVERPEVEAPAAKSLKQQVFESRLELATEALKRFDQEAFEGVIALIQADLQTLLDTKSIRVIDRWRELQALVDMERLRLFDPATKAALISIAAPLMGEVNLRGDEEACQFDRLVAEAQLTVVKVSPRLATLQARIQDDVSRLPRNLAPVKAHGALILAVGAGEFWDKPSFSTLEEMRSSLRGLMQFKPSDGAGIPFRPAVLDVTDGDEQREDVVPKVSSRNLDAYKQRVREVLREKLDKDEAIVKIRAGLPVTDADLERLAVKVQKVDPTIDLLKLPRELQVHQDLSRLLRGLVGLDSGAVHDAFHAFFLKYPLLTSTQRQFVSAMEQRLVASGGLEIERLYQDPFSRLHEQGIDGVFPDPEQVDDLVEILNQFNAGELPAAKIA